MAGITVFTCPKCGETYEQGGNCPKCGAKLEPLEEDERVS